MTQDTQENNRLIAEFMGYYKNGDFMVKRNGSGIFAAINLSKYHTSFDWLMPVVQKINELCKTTGYPDTLEISHLRLVSTDINYAYYAVTEFLTWYNKQQEK